MYQYIHCTTSIKLLPSLTHLPYCLINASVNWVHIGSGNGLSPVRRQAITGTNAGVLSIELLGTNFSQILSFSVKKMHLKLSSAGTATILSRGRWVNSLRPSDAYIASVNWVVPGSGLVALRTYFSEISVEIHIFIKNNATENVVYKLAAVLSGPQCVNTFWATLHETSNLCDQAAVWTVQSVHPSVTPFSLCSCHYISMKFSGLITIDTSDACAKGQDQRSKVKVTEVKTNFDPNWAFPDHNSSLNKQLATKGCKELAVA